MLEQLAGWENLLLGFRKAAAGKRGRPNVAAFEHRLEDNLLTLRADLMSRRYRPGAYASFYIHDPKRRLISAAPFRDRVVHHALCTITEPIFERSFSGASFANRIGKGTHRALERAQALARRFAYVLQFDVEQFFPAIDHRILRDILTRKLGDTEVLWLVDRILASGEGVLRGEYRLRSFPGDAPSDASRPRGLPIGNLTSQFWANCYLNPFDHFVQRELRSRGYVRYVDDGLMFAQEKGTLWHWREAIIGRLAGLRLTIHQGAHPRPVSEGFPFLGFVIYPTHRRLKRRNVINYRHRLRRLIAGFNSGERTREAVLESLRGWINHARYGDTWGLRKSVTGQLNSVQFVSGGAS